MLASKLNGHAQVANINQMLWFHSCDASHRWGVPKPLKDLSPANILLDLDAIVCITRRFLGAWYCSHISSSNFSAVKQTITRGRARCVVLTAATDIRER
jgi:hypothetical protein